MERHDPSIRTEDLSLSELHDLIREIDAIQALYETNKILFFKALRQGDQGRFFEMQQSSVRLVLGSNRSGKTACGTAEGVAHVIGYRPWLPEDHPLRIVRLPNGDPIPVPNIGRVLAQNYKQAINQTIWPKWQEWFPQHMIKRIVRNAQGVPTELYATNGSIVYFMSDDQDDLAFEGAAGHWCHIDEPCGQRKYTGLRRGLVDHGGHLWFTMTPLGAYWINEKVVERAENPGSGVTLFKFSVWDNLIENGGYLSRVAVEDFLSDLREDELEARLHGNFIQLAGRVYKEWEPREPYWIDPHDIPPSWPRVCIIDPHARKPIAVVWLAVSPDNQVFVYRELYDPMLKTVEDVSKRIHELETDSDGNKEPVVTRIIDDSAQEPGRVVALSIKQAFWEHGIRCSLAQKRNAQAGYDAIHSALKKGKYEWDEPQLVVFKCCPTVKSNFMNFAFDDWQTSGQRDIMGEKDAIRKTHDDFVDCIRYYYQGGWDYYRLKGQMRQQERKAHDDELVDLSKKFTINMPGNQTGYGRPK
jgi:hypothetical protein